VLSSPVMTHAKQRFPPESEPQITRSMNGFSTLEEAIRREEAEQVAYFLGVSATVVRAWRREPETEEGSATGRRSPLDRACDLIDAVYRVNPEGADLIFEHIRSHLESLKAARSRPAVEIEDLKAQVKDLQAIVTRISDQLRTTEGSKLTVVK
jgi:hypothetical protein